MLKKTILVITVVILLIFLSGCMKTETKEKINNAVDKFDNAVEKNKPADKLITGVLGK